MAPMTIIRTAINDVLIKKVSIALTIHNEIRNVFFNAFLLNLKQASPMIATAALLNPAKMTFIDLLSNSGIKSPNKSNTIDAGMLKYKKATNPPRQL